MHHMSRPMRQLTRGQRQNKCMKHRGTASVDTTMGEHELTPTYANGPRLGGSNLDCILEYTTPSVQCQYQSKQSAITGPSRERWKSQSENISYFNLGDLWHSFDEWSAYGAGVPLKLPSGETIVQYYVPYLSALQIYMYPGLGVFASKRRLGDESDWSDASDMRDTNSDFGSDNENDKLLSRTQIRGEQWESSSSISSASSEHGDRHGDLALEYFERCSPYGRAPLAGKIIELANRFPLLLSLRSHEVSPASWFSVAWYPIYRIPMGPTMSDLSTCFLTFHALWTPPYLQDLGEECRVKAGANDRSVEATPCQPESEYGQEQWLQDQAAWRINSGTLELPAFGLASYKLRGPFWASAAPADKQHVALLAKSADSWLKQLRVQHPDYEFFSSREAMKFDR